VLARQHSRSTLDEIKVNIHIHIPFAGAETHTPLWANEEAAIDFQKEPQRAERCTIAFGAMELKHFLLRTLVGTVTVAFGSQRSDDAFTIRLMIETGAGMPGGFRLTLEPGGLTITGYDRAGVLYGVYELLRLQGWRWYAPGKHGEIPPNATDQLVLPDHAQEYAPSFNLGRGFDFEYASMDSAEFWLWMARNRLNMCGLRPASNALTHKLGMSPKVGGHLFEAILDPDRPMSCGRTLWEEHPEWYGLPNGGTRDKKSALTTQFCVSRTDLIAFLAEELLQRLMGPWHDAARIELWGFDTWGNTCACPDCRALGNSADQLEYFMDCMRAHIDQARLARRLDHDVQLGTCAYEGTATLSGPHKPVPAAMSAGGDCVTFYPINRCYAHDLGDPDCHTNFAYQAALASWLERQDHLPVVAAEYYNVSKYEDLPLLFTGHMQHDLHSYYEQGARGLTYMHVPMVNWAMRTLTQALYAQLAWDIHTDVAEFASAYFDNWYGPYAGEMRQAYDLIETAWRFIADWRAWAGNSILSQLLAWDGARPAQPLKPTGHFDAPAAAISSGRQSLQMMHDAEARINACMARQHEDSSGLLKAATQQTPAQNPVLARAMDHTDCYESRLGEDRRLLRYGMDVMRLMTEVVAYHEALRTGDEATADSAWGTITQVAASLDLYYIPIGYEWPGPGLESKDALTRSQLRQVLNRCRSQRKPRA
jgi:Domain of unknown function (DUF4838)